MLKFGYMKNKLYSQIKSALKVNPQIIAAYVIGSTVSKKYTEESDFDLVVVTHNKKALSHDKVYGLIEHIKFPKNLDLSIVDKSSSPIFLYQIVAKGERIYAKNQLPANDFEAFALHNYYDTAHIRNIYHTHLKEKLLAHVNR